MKMLTTDSHNNLKKFAQAIMLIKANQIVNLNEITLLEFGGTQLLVKYLLFKVGIYEYCFRDGNLRVCTH